MKTVWIIALTLLLTANVSFASGAVETVTFDVQGMTCATCPIAVRKAMQRVDGVTEVLVSLKDMSAKVTFDPGVTTPSEIGNASSNVGFPATAKDSK